MFQLDLSLERPFDRSQNLGPNLVNLLKPKICSRDVRGCLGAMFDDLSNKLCIDMKKAGNGPCDRSQNMGPN